MDLNILNNVKMGTKGNDFIFSFIDELTKTIKKGKERDNNMNLQNDEEFSTKSRDSYVLKRNELLIDYANRRITKWASEEEPGRSADTGRCQRWCTSFYPLTT